MKTGTLTIEFIDPVDVNRMRNFGEDLWKALRENRHAIIDLEEVDRATKSLAVTIKPPSPSRFRDAEAIARKILKRHLYTTEFRILPIKD